MKRLFSFLALLLVLAPISAAGDKLVGFFPSSRDTELAAEAVLQNTPAPEKARRWLAQLTEEPHVAGTSQEKEVAEYVRERLIEMGLETEVVSYDVFLNYPKNVSVRLIEPEEEELSLREEFIAADKDSSARGMFPAFHGYAASGQASGQVVYVNYGTPEDFERLAKMGISPEGHVVLARYGKVFRGLKVREAEKRGAVGILIYSDPADDGYMRGDVYPDGPMRPPSAIQRGSVQFLSVQPGDPSTPGYPARANAPRLQRSEMKNLPRIPSLPLSYGEAEKILRLLGGARVPDDWQGGLPFAYHVGPGGAAVELEVEMEGGLRPIYNVFARIPGNEEADQLVILGNHRDAWNHGAVDPNSGTAAWLETARGLAAAIEAGWQPRRTILLASWDAEEYGLVGSVEWGEDRATELAANAVAYVNLDSAVTGPDLEVSGTPSLLELVRTTAADVSEPMKSGSLLDAWEQRLAKSWAQEEPIDLADPEAVFEPRLGALGSGSDYTVFLDHLGIPSMSFGFSGPSGVYHSVYDNFRWMEKFGDPQFVYHAAAARFFGLLAMRLAGSEVVAFRFSSYAEALERELDELERSLVRKTRLAVLEGEETLSLDLTPVREALAALGAAGRSLDGAVDRLLEKQDSGRVESLNRALIQIERAFLSTDGLPARPWFRHLLYAPGLTTGYGAWPFPELAEAVESRDQELADRGVERLTTVLAEATQRLEAAAALAAD
ncbi:MAG: M28 family metallopeptidase [Thermoanaerobaculia bacterium]